MPGRNVFHLSSHKSYTQSRSQSDHKRVSQPYNHITISSVAEALHPFAGTCCQEGTTRLYTLIFPNVPLWRANRLTAGDEERLSSRTCLPVVTCGGHVGASFSRNVLSENKLASGCSGPTTSQTTRLNVWVVQCQRRSSCRCCLTSFSARSSARCAS
jgi:hypothetical protein